MLMTAVVLNGQVSREDDRLGNDAADEGCRLWS